MGEILDFYKEHKVDGINMNVILHNVNHDHPPRIRKHFVTFSLLS